ncbi:MAG: DUF4230 domain-containing protein [Phototrophicaceae bacterium]
MSNQPPLPPELGTDYRPVNQAQSDYIEIEVPIEQSSQAPIPERSNANCLWSCGSMMGCGLLMVGLIAGTLYLGTDLVLGNFTSFFNLPSVNVSFGDSAQPFIPDDVYIPTIERVQLLSELTTTRYNYADVTAGVVDMPQWLSALYGDSAVMVVVGTIEAGIDVGDITAESIVYDELTRIMTITLPAPELQSCFLDESQSYVVRRSTGFFADPMDNLEDELRQRALVYYRDTAIEEGILLDAETDARNTLGELLSILVNDDTVTITIDFLAPNPDEPFPQSCQ